MGSLYRVHKKSYIIDCSILKMYKKIVCMGGEFP